MPPRIPPHKKEQILKLRNEGLSIKAAAEVTGVSYRWAKAWFANLPADDGAAYKQRAAEEKVPTAAVPYEKLSPEAQRGWDDFDYFRRRYLGHVSTPWQLDAAKEIIASLNSPEREYIVINVSPGAGKSTLLVDIGVWLTVRNRAMRGLYVCRTTSLSNRSLGRLRRSLERTSVVRAKAEDIAAGIACDAEATICHDYGRFKPDHGADVWRREEFTVVQADGAPVEEKEPTWSAFGFDQGYLGNRFDVMFADDLDDKTTTRTLEVVENNRRTYDEELETRLEPGGLIVNCQQRLGRNDFSAHCLAKQIETDDDDDEDESTGDAVAQYRHIVYKAHFEDRCKGEHKRDSPPYPAGCLLDPRRITWKDIRRAKGNRTRYAVVYQQEEADPQGVLVRPIWVSGGSDQEGEYIGCWDNDRGLWEIPNGISGRTIATVDPSPTRQWAIQCLATGTAVLTERGELPIEEVTTDDRVMTREGWKPVQSVVYKGFRPTIELSLSSGRVLRLTPDHRVLTPGGWVEAGSLTAGSRLVVSPVLTGDAKPLALSYRKVVAAERVSADAVSLTGLLGSSSLTAKNVHPRRDRLQVGGTNTGPVSTQVIERESIRDFTNEMLVNEAMSESFAGGVAGDHAVSVLAETVPFPAALRDGDSIHDPRLVHGYLAAGVEFSVATPNAAGGSSANHLTAIDADVHVTSVRTAGDSDVWDIGVFDLHEFTAEGVIVHNCWHVDPESQTRWLLALYNGKLTAAEFLDHKGGAFTGIAEDFQLTSIEMGHPIDTWIFEINAAQRFFLSTDYVQRWQRERGTHFLQHTTHRNKVDPKMGPGIISNPWRYGQVRLPGRRDSRHRVMSLVDQVTRWSPDQEMTDDQVMANWFMELHLPDLIRPPANNLRLWRPSWLTQGAA